jgi:hypothetical protein
MEWPKSFPMRCSLDVDIMVVVGGINLYMCNL